MRLAIFCFFLAIYLGTTSGHVYTIDSYLNYAVTRSMGSAGTLAVPRFMMTVEGTDGRHYSKLGIGQSLVSVPLYWVGSLVERLSPANPTFRAYSKAFYVRQDSKTMKLEPQTLVRVSDQDGARVFFTTLTNAFVAAALCLLFWMMLVRFGLSSAGAFAGTLVLGFATPVWIYARDFFAEPLFTVCLLGTLLLVADQRHPAEEEHRARGRLVLAGLASAMGILARANFAPIAAGCALYLVFDARERSSGLRNAARYGIGCLPGAILLGAANLARFGSIFQTGYHTAFDKGFSVPLANGILWNLASPYRSILLYAPPVAIFALGLREFLRTRTRIAMLFLGTIAYVFLLYSKWWAWHGGWCWGPRFMLPILPLLLAPGLLAAKTRWVRLTLCVLALAGFVVQLSGILINYTAAYDYWIKIGRLDWAEASIERLPQIGVHLRALAATSPADYDLWIVQAGRAVGFPVVWALVGIGALVFFALRRYRSAVRRVLPAGSAESG